MKRQRRAPGGRGAGAPDDARSARAAPERRQVPIERPAGLNDLLLARLRQDIVADVFGFGERLSEEQLSQHYGVTRAPVRSTLIKLQAEGLIRIVPQRGAFVFDPTIDEVRALCELRSALELEAARLAMQRSRGPLTRTLHGLVERMTTFAAAVNDLRYQQLDSEFHLCLLDAARSPLLHHAYLQTVHWRFAALRQRLARDVDNAARSFDEHRRILELVSKGDEPGLAQALRIHIERSNDYYARLLALKVGSDLEEDGSN